MHSRRLRRHRVTPIVDRRNEYVWARTLAALELQPLSSNSNSAASNEAVSPAIQAPAPAAPTSSSSSERLKRTSILDLPIETQKAIFQYSSPSDLLCLALVSKHFRHIAAAHLYRSFHIVFPTHDGPEIDAQSDAFAAGLDTFATSDYDYGQYVREFIVEPTCGLEHTQDAYRDYLADTSCGKFLNTLLLLALRKTKALETFKWDIRVEPSHQVYKALHSIEALQHLHIRLHAGSSVYTKTLPNSLPNLSSSSNINSNLNPSASFPQTGPPPPPPTNPAFVFVPMTTLPPGVSHPHPVPDTFPTNPGSPPVPGNTNVYKSYYNRYKAIRFMTYAKSHKLSGFKNLKTLAVLDMDSLDCVPELNRCIANSWTTLRTLRLSFSEALSMKSKKPQPELHSDDDSDPDDDFTQLVPPPPGGIPPPTAPLPGSNDAPTKALKALEEKKKQEAVLAHIFGISHPVPERVLPPFPDTRKQPEDIRKAFAKNLAPLGKLLLKIIKEDHDQSEIGKAALDIITKASQAYVDRLDEKPRAPGVASTGLNNSSIAVPESSPETEDKSTSDDTERGLFDKPVDNKTSKRQQGEDTANPDDIDVEEPEEVQAPDPAAEPASTESDHEPEEAANLNLANVKVGDSPTNKSEAEGIGPGNGDSELLDPAKTTESEFYRVYLIRRERLQAAIEHMLRERDAIEGTDAIDKAKKLRLLNATNAYMDDLIQLEMQFKTRLGSSQTLKEAPEGSEKVNDYVRQTRGLNLETLAIYLIPIKAGIILSAINIHFLRSITLLDVGHQNVFWASASKENSISPLPLSKIYTDNVSMHFLAFVYQLQSVDELLMVERKPHSMVENTTPKTNVTIDQIRRTVLKRHARTLKVLVIQNDDTSDWDLNTQSAILLCQRAKALEELAVSFGIKTMHTLLQFLPGMVQLRALHAIDFRHDDTCVWVMREFRNFAVDAISHNPQMKLEYLALGLGVERLVRHIPKKVDKGKGKAKRSGGGKTIADMLLPGAPVSESALALLKMGFVPNLMNPLDDSDDDDLRVGGKNGLVVETVQGIDFSDIPGVRIFEKDVLNGRL